MHTSESDRISSLAREALEEMRLSVRGLTGKPVHLLDALGDWRAEVVSRLGQANINAEWKSPSEDITHTLPARAYVQTTRIFREAVSNIIKHSGGTNCTISCSVQDGDFVVVIQDNGQGIPGRAGRPPGPRPRHGQHEVAGQADAWPMSGGVGPWLGNRDPPHDSPLTLQPPNPRIIQFDAAIAEIVIPLDPCPAQP